MCGRMTRKVRNSESGSSPEKSEATKSEIEIDLNYNNETAQLRLHDALPAADPDYPVCFGFVYADRSKNLTPLYDYSSDRSDRC